MSIFNGEKNLVHFVSWMVKSFPQADPLKPHHWSPRDKHMYTQTWNDEWDWLWLYSYAHLSLHSVIVAVCQASSPGIMIIQSSWYHRKAGWFIIIKMLIICDIALFSLKLYTTEKKNMFIVQASVTDYKHIFEVKFAAGSLLQSFHFIRSFFFKC